MVLGPPVEVLARVALVKVPVPLTVSGPLSVWMAVGAAMTLPLLMVRAARVVGLFRARLPKALTMMGLVSVCPGPLRVAVAGKLPSPTVRPPRAPAVGPSKLPCSTTVPPAQLAAGSAMKSRLLVMRN